MNGTIPWVCKNAEAYPQPHPVLAFLTAGFTVLEATNPSESKSSLTSGEMFSQTKSLFYFFYSLPAGLLLNYAWLPLACCVEVFKLESLVIHV